MKARVLKFKPKPGGRSWTSYEARYFARLRMEGKWGQLVPIRSAPRQDESQAP